ncbi:putative serine/threonine protein kinase [Actinacidiphila reveromycinica]|uniref:non-specific serine/threonine protein kinase n=1 Tax=Actinacidiphila reveromycinica TaxID=659352 RepID=A0A7U3VQB7_9ACTN|nr:protein kinase [Streptomyces sp. SN-593]BBA99605.1 putative serine/threonine protein kinase [Streptomyces sp. SN-593]
MDGAGHGDEGRLVAGRYRLLERVGRGGMGTVWRAEDELLGRLVAVKKLHSPQPHMDDEELATLFERTRREARAAARISHPNVVVVHDVVDDAGLPSIVMEYVPSVTLGERLKEQGPLEPAEAARVGRGMIAALRAAHRAGVLHRDVKPGNVLLGGDQRVVLTDFGIAQASGTSTLTRTGELIGSIDFLSPERIRGVPPGPEADLWALGATLYQAVEGSSPFRRPTAIETAYAIAEEPVRPPAKAGALIGVITGLLAKEPGDRLSADEAERMLRVPAADSDTTRVDRGRFESPPGQTTTTRVAPYAPASHAAPPGPATGHPPSGGPAGGLTAPPGGPGGAHAVPPPAGGRRHRALPWIAAAVAAAVVIGGALYAVHRANSSSAEADPAPTGTSGTASPSTAPTGGQTTPAPPLPAGYRLAEEDHDGYHYSVPVPDGWKRTTPNGTDEVDWVTPDGLVGLKVDALPFASTDPLEHFQELEPQTEQAVGDTYHRERMDRTVRLGQQAALWEFTFQGKARAWHAIDLGFGRPGATEYAIYLSAPDAQWQKWRPVFDNAVAGFRAAD